jgi:hypothetical protein
VSSRRVRILLERYTRQSDWQDLPEGRQRRGQ